MKRITLSKETVPVWVATEDGPRMGSGYQVRGYPLLVHQQWNEALQQCGGDPYHQRWKVATPRGYSVFPRPLPDLQTTRQAIGFMVCHPAWLLIREYIETGEQDRDLLVGADIRSLFQGLDAFLMGF